MERGGRRRLTNDGNEVTMPAIGQSILCMRGGLLHKVNNYCFAALSVEVRSEDNRYIKHAETQKAFGGREEEERG